MTSAIRIDRLTRKYGRTDAVNGLSLDVQPGRCYGFFGRNGAGKTTTIKCMLRLLKPDSGSIEIFGMDVAKNEMEIKSRLAYVPDVVAFYPWMTIRETLEYFRSFRKHWNLDLEKDLLNRFGLDASQKTSGLSKGQKTQVALILAIAPEPDLLLLDEPTSGLDPLVRREFIETVIGSYQEGDPGKRTVFVSTHLISEFEGLIDEFMIIDKGKELLTASADEARGLYKKIRARFGGAPPVLQASGVLSRLVRGNELELVANGNSAEIVAELKQHAPQTLDVGGLSLEEIFSVTVKGERVSA